MRQEETSVVDSRQPSSRMMMRCVLSVYSSEGGPVVVEGEISSLQQCTPRCTHTTVSSDMDWISAVNIEVLERRNRRKISLKSLDIFDF